MGLGVPDLAPHLQTSQNARRNLGDLQNQNIAVHEGVLEDDGSADADGKNCKQNFDNYDVDNFRWGRSNHVGSSFHFGVENDCMLEKSILLVYGVGPLQCPEMEAQSWVPEQRCTVGHTDGEMGWRGEGLMTQTQLRKEDVVRNLVESMKEPVDKKKESKGSVPTKKPKDLLHSSTLEQWFLESH